MTSLTGQGWKIEGKRGKGRLTCNKPQAKRPKNVFILKCTSKSQLKSFRGSPDAAASCLQPQPIQKYQQFPLEALLLLLRNHIGPMRIFYSFPKFSLQNSLKLFVSGQLYFCFCVFVFDTESHSVDQVGLELTVDPRSNSELQPRLPPQHLKG